MPEFRELGQRLLDTLRGTKAPESLGEATVLSGLAAALHTEGLLKVELSSLPVAVGQALAGMRVAAFLDGPELAGAHELLAWAAGRSLPMVVHAHLRGGPGHAEAAGTGHEGWHAVADAGCVQLMAQSVQELADLTVVARLVAEAALLPVIVGMDADQLGDGIQSLQLPVDGLVSLVSSPDDRIETPTPAQQCLFGQERRRLPRWHDLDRPALHGAAQGRRSWGLGAAAREPYLHQPVAGLVASAMSRVGALTGRPLGPLSEHGHKNAPVVLVAQGSAVELGRAAVAGEKAAAVIGLRCLRPFPATELASRLGKRPVFVLERVSGDLARRPPLRREVEAHAQGPVRSLLGGAGGHALRLVDLHHALAEPPEHDLTWLGVDFATQLKTPHPTQQAHLDGLKRHFGEGPAGLRSSQETELDGVVVRLPPELVETCARLLYALFGGAVRARRGWVHWSPAELGDPGDDPEAALQLEGAASAVLGGLLGWLRRRGMAWKERDALRIADELGLDSGAFLAAWDQPPPVPKVPEPSPRRTPLVVRELGADQAPDSMRRFWGSVGLPFCEGSPLAPDPGLAVGAIPPLTSTFHDLTTQRERLPVFDPAHCTGCGDCWVACPEGALGVLAVSSRNLVDVAGQGTSALKPVAGKLAKALRKGIEGDAGSSLRDTGAAVVQALPEPRRQAAVDALEQGAERLEGLPLAAPWKEDLLLSLVIDPAACTACGSCAQACPHSPALTVQPQTAQRVASARRAWDIWAGLPDTAGKAMETLAPRMGPLAARLLSRHCALALAGGNGEEPGSGAKLTLRAALAMAEAVLQPALLGQLKALDDLKQALDQAVRAELADALPAGASLEQALGNGGVRATGLTPKDEARIRRRSRLAGELSELRERLNRGTRGLPRARVGLVLEPSLAERWGIEFPYNPFQAPAVVAGAGRAVALGAGLLTGQLEQAGVGDALLASAAAELSRKSPERLKPPVMVVGHDALLRDEGLQEALELPLKLLVVVEEPVNEDLLLLDLQRRGALVAQSTIGDPDHLAEVLLAAIKHAGPAVVRVLAPSPGRHGLDPALSIPHAAKQVAEGQWALWSLAPDQSLRQVELRTPVSAGVLHELGQTAALREQLEMEYSAREAALRAELEQREQDMKADEDARFQARLEERLMALAGLLDPQDGA